MANSYSKTCPDCGAENDSNDLFCKECGTSLAMVNSSSQQTAAFTPLSNGNEPQTTAITPAAPSASPDYAATPTPPAPDYSGIPAGQPPSYSYTSEPESTRGAVLGWLAATLILIILAAFLWSSVISDSARESITGIF